MRITVRLFAVLRERSGMDRIELDLPPASSVEVAVARVAEQAPALRALLSRAAVAVNREYVKPDCKLSDGDELALIPPVSGG